MKDLRDGDKPNLGASLAGERPSERASEAAADGVKQGRGEAVIPSSSSDVTPSERSSASVSTTNEGGSEPSGRRRRRRRKSARKAENKASSDPYATNSPPASPTNVPAPGEKKGRRRRRKSGREIQGRPLAPQKTPGQAHSKSHPGTAGHASAASAQAGSGASPVVRRQADDLYAALDLGTNNCRLLIAQPTRPGQFRVVDAFSRIVRLGEGLDATGELSQDAMDRAVEALKVCAGKLKNRPVRRHRLIATEACRSARNGEDLTENRSNRLANHIKAWTSLPVGVVTLSERHGGCLVTPAVFQAMVEEVDAMLADFDPPPLPAFSALGESRIHLLGTSGTVTTLAGLHLDLPRYDRRKVDGLWLSNEDVDLMLDKLLSWDFDARAANPCIGADRADLVLAGCAILQSIRKRWPSQRMRVADRGLREGLLNEMMASDGAWRRSGRNFRHRNHRSAQGEKT